MKLLSFVTDDTSLPRLGACLDDSTIIDMVDAYDYLYQAEAPDWFGSVGDLLQGGEKAMELAQEVIEQAKKSKDVDQLTRGVDDIIFLPPTTATAKLLCVTMNFLSHSTASNSNPAKEPYFFIKMPNLMTPHGAPIMLSRTSEKHDSEIEVGVVIGKRGKYISREDAFDYIAGYTICNDFSFRDRRTLPSDPDTPRLHWLTLKNLDCAAPIGPWLVTRDEIPDPYKLEVNLSLDNDPEVRDHGTTEDMLHKIPDLIAHASDGLTLEPGDVIMSGTPLSVAFGEKRFLKDGDILRAEISGIGALVNPIVMES